MHGIVPFEPWMQQGFFRRQPLCGIDDEQAIDEIQRLVRYVTRHRRDASKTNLRKKLLLIVFIFDVKR